MAALYLCWFWVDFAVNGWLYAVYSVVDGFLAIFRVVVPKVNQIVRTGGLDRVLSHVLRFFIAPFDRINHSLLSFGVHAPRLWLEAFGRAKSGLLLFELENLLFILISAYLLQLAKQIFFFDPLCGVIHLGVFMFKLKLLSDQQTFLFLHFDHVESLKLLYFIIAELANVVFDVHVCVEGSFTDQIVIGQLGGVDDAQDLKTKILVLECEMIVN